MNITLYSHELFWLYIQYCIVFGVLSYVLYCGVCVMLSISDILKCSSFDMYKHYLSAIICGNFKKRNFSDIICILIIAISVLAVSFIANSGEFRVLSIPLLLLGFKIGMLLFKKIEISALSFLIYLIKKVIDMLLLPITLLIRILTRVFTGIFVRFKKKIQTVLIARYTTKMYNGLDKIKHNGMLAQLFEEV